MSAKAIREATGKTILNNYLKGSATLCKLAVVDENTSFEQALAANPWISQEVRIETTVYINFDRFILFLFFSL